MGKINILDSDVANMIAAGEVVDNPASVVKELIENSIDAGADSISVEIKNGGISYIRITDNGSGIEPDDMSRVFMRHATSKLLNASDLEKICTLGFRGEAMCSVASVAKVTLTSKTKHESCAYRVYVEGGEMEDVSEVGAPDGTTIEVRELFYNTPARMKFLKKDTKEMAYVTEVVQKFILAYPEVSFKYVSNGKQVLFSSGDNNPVNAIYSVYGKDYASNVIPVNYSEKGIKVTGFVGKTTLSRPNRTYQSFFVNKRNIKSPLLNVALDEAYKNQLMGGKFPFAVILIEVNPEFLDVNVHPHKTIVKFSDEKLIFDAVYWAAKNALYEKPTIPDVIIPAKKQEFKMKNTDTATEYVQQQMPIINKPESKAEEQKKEEPKVNYQPPVKPEPYFNSRLREPGTQYVVTPEKKEEPKEDIYTLKPIEPVEEEITETAKPKSEEKIVNAPYIEPEIKTEPEAKNDTADEKLPTVAENKPIDDYKIIGQAFQTYIILEKDDKMYIIDQHAAHERLNYERLKKELEESGVFSQMLISPEIIRLSESEFACAMDNMDYFYKIGFEIDAFGRTEIAVNTVPIDIDCGEIKDLIVELITQLMNSKKEIIGEKQLRALYTIACKSAIKANKTLCNVEIKSLADSVFAMDGINTCPHGRPIMITLSKYEMEKQFKRIL